MGCGGHDWRWCGAELQRARLRRILGCIVLAMLAVNLARRWKPGVRVGGHPSYYGIAAGFATTVANAAGPVMSMYLLMKNLPKEQFVATGAWFFLVVNLAKLPIYAVITSSVVRRCSSTSR